MVQALNQAIERGRMRRHVIGVIVLAGLLPLVLGGAVLATAGSQTVETTAAVEVRVWQSVHTDALYLSTRPAEGPWTTHNTPLDMSALPFGRKLLPEQHHPGDRPGHGDRRHARRGRPRAGPGDRARSRDGNRLGLGVPLEELLSADRIDPHVYRL